MKIKIILLTYIILNAVCVSTIQSITDKFHEENNDYYSKYMIPISKPLPNNLISEMITSTNENVTTHRPIRIIGDNGFSEKNGVIGGTGDKDNPYIIEHWEIQGTPFWRFINQVLHVLEQSLLDNKLVYFVNIPICGIYLKDTTKHVILRNNYIFNWTGTQRDLLQIAGITLINASNVTIESNTFYNNNLGVNIENAQWIIKKFENYTQRFIQCYNSMFLIIQDNIFTLNSEAALVLYSTNKSQIIRNTFSQNECGIRLATSNMSIEQNQIVSNGNGILCTQTDFSTINNNTIMSNGNGIYCAESGPDLIGSNPKITGNYITGNAAGIYICTNYPVITNNSIIGNKFGIMNMGLSELPVIIVDNEIKENEWGIDYIGSCIIEHNLVTLNDEGISIRGNASVNQNIISFNNGNGISCGSANIQGYEMVPNIHYNNIINNTLMGIHWKTSSTWIDATFNYWGSADGPSGYGPGSGDEVDQQIIFEPWLSEMSQQAGPR